MTNFSASLGWGLLVGASLLLGSIAGAWLRLPSRVAATITAFGGGLLLAAVALELVPEADRLAGKLPTAIGLAGGTLAFVGADAWLTRDDDMEAVRRSGHAAAAGREMDMPERASNRMEASRGKAIAAGLFVDGVPESVALGLTIAEGEIGFALLVGVLVGNLVEAYGAAQPIVAGGLSKRFAVALLGGIGIALALATLAGGTVLAEASDGLIGMAQAVAAGAVLAVVSISIVPHAFKEVSGMVATAITLGFIGGYLLT